MNTEKIMIFLAAQNCAGKTSIAEMLHESFEAKAYSVRKIIETEAKNRGVKLASRKTFTQFSQGVKRVNGSGYFLQQALDDFMKEQARVAIVESIRCPGELAWIKNQQSLHLKMVPIGIIAEEPIRYDRFLHRTGAESLASTISQEEFLKQENLVNSGKRPWQENVAEVLKAITFKIENNHQDFSELKKNVFKIESFVSSL